MTDRCLIIAEAGVNHNGDVDLALQLVDRAAEAGRGCRQVPDFPGRSSGARRCAQGRLPKRTTGRIETQHQMLRRLELWPSRRTIWSCSAVQRAGSNFCRRPARPTSLAFLVNVLNQKRIKLGSGELTNAPLLLATARTEAQIILSTGMGTLAEVEEALGVLAFGMLGGPEPSRRAFAEALHQPGAWDLLRQRVRSAALHHRIPGGSRADQSSRDGNDVAGLWSSVGYSDHTEGLAVSLAAVALGACMIEKHFTLDRNLPGPDHAASSSPTNLRNSSAAFAPSRHQRETGSSSRSAQSLPTGSSCAAASWPRAICPPDRCLTPRT